MNSFSRFLILSNRGIGVGLDWESNPGWKDGVDADDPPDYGGPPNFGQTLKKPTIATHRFFTPIGQRNN